MNVTGHQAIVERLTSNIARNIMHHAYLFVGLAGVGKQHVAKELVHQITGKPASPANPFFVSLQQELHEKTGKYKKNIDVGQIRDMIARLQIRVADDEHMTVIIDNAHLLSIGAANALLKTLEEPRGNSVLFLITDQPDMLPSTIVSRCQVEHFGAATDEEVRSVLPASPHKQHIVRFARGRVGLAMRLATDTVLFEQYCSEMSRFASMLDEPLYKQRQLVASLYGDKSDHIAQRAVIDEAIDVWLGEVHDRLLKEPYLAKAAEQMFRAKQLLKRNVHPKLLVESILLSLR